jgi:hypothetical protein
MPESEDITNEPSRDRPDDEDDFTDRPRRYPDEEEGESYRRRRPYGDEFRKRSWLERELINTNIAIIVIFALCCNGIALIVGIIGVLTCQDPEAKHKARILLIVGGILTALGVGCQILSAFMKPGGAGR